MRPGLPMWRGPTLLLAALLLLLPLTPGTAPGATNEAVDPGGGGVSLLGSGPVTVLGIPTGNAVSSASAEINPSAVTAGATGVSFAYDVLPDIQAGDTGVDRIAITVPAGYGNLSVTSVETGGGAIAAACPAPGANEYCASVSGQTVTVTLGTPVTASNTRITVRFQADAPASAGTGDFTASVDDTATPAVPPQIVTPGDADGNPVNANTYTVVTVLGVDPAQSTFTAAPIIVLADGVSASTLTATLRDSAGQPVQGKDIQFSTDRIGIDSVTQPVTPTDISGTATGSVSSSVPGVATATARDVTDGFDIPVPVQVYFTQGLVLQLTKTASTDEAVVGDVVAYLLEVRNTSLSDVVSVRLDDRLPANFKYRRGSARLNGAQMADPAGNRVLTFDVGTVPGLVDANGNGQADPGEPGYAAVSYQLVVGSGARPGEYRNTAVARDVCGSCYLSNQARTDVEVTLDPLLDLGTIIGKVFQDGDGDGWQDEGEQGIAGVMVALDDGTYALTDEHGRYHFPAVMPGHRLVKVNLHSLPVGASVTTEEALVVSVTPGLLVKANFGIMHSYDIERTGRPERLGILMTSQERREPMQVVGSTETLSVLINGRIANLPIHDARLAVQSLEEVVTVKGGNLLHPLRFVVSVDHGSSVESWRLSVLDSRERLIHRAEGSDAPPQEIEWDGRHEVELVLEGGEIYQYQMEISYADGGSSSSARRLFGVNRISVISLNLTGGAFEMGASDLTTEARNILAEAAEVLREYPLETIVIEGHTDSVGGAEYNVELSRERAEAARSYLVDVEDIPAERFVIKAHGESRPLASNATTEGRELNRRVEVKGDVREVNASKLHDQYRNAPLVRINGSTIETDGDGRFRVSVDSENSDSLDVEMASAQGRSVSGTVRLPHVEILSPRGEHILSFGAEADGYRVAEPGEPGGIAHGGAAVVHRFSGRTDPRNTVTLDGRPLETDEEGGFSAVLALMPGRNTFGLTVTNPEGYTRIATLIVTVRDRREDGEPVVAVEHIPTLEVKFPPAGKKLGLPVLTLTGLAEPDCAVSVNGKTVDLTPAGEFAATVELPPGRSRVVVEAVDREGHVARIEREVEVSDTRIFLLAFADMKFGQLSGKGHLEGAGMDSSHEFYTEGRLAFYLKGVIKGKYLITAALDTGTGEADELFRDLDEKETERLLTNLDPDKLYPVYGDDSTIVYDTESQGAFYLALESEDLDILVGNYPLSLDDTELSTYRRTLFGARAAYHSVSRTRYGEHNTQLVVFGAEVRQSHVQDELRATGGSLYYLSHDDVIEGSEQVSIIVREENSGLILSRTPQTEGVDYRIKYDEGRIVFNRPISSVEEDPTLADRGALGGHKVFIEVDYETEAEFFEKTAAGGRVRQQLGDHVAVGGTYVRDELAGGTYELRGVDVEVRLGEHGRVVGEYAESEGQEASTFSSDDGGLTFTESAPNGSAEGSAWKVAAELDVGGMMGDAGRARVGGYVKRLEEGFSSSGNTAESGTLKTGAHLDVKITDMDRLRARFDHVEDDAPGENRIGDQDVGTIQWIHDHGWFRITSEYQSRSGMVGTEDKERQDIGSVRLEVEPWEPFHVGIRQQLTFTGEEDNRTTLEMTYQALPSLALRGKGTLGTLADSAEAGAVLTLEDGNVYVTEKLTDGPTGRSNSTILGGETRLGPSSTLYTEYQWERDENERRTVSVLGARRTWDLKQGFSLFLSGEHASVDAGTRTTRYAVAGGASFLREKSLRLRTKAEFRKEDGATDYMQYLTENLAEVRLGRDFVLLGKHRWSETRDTDRDEVESRYLIYSLGLAYRPVDSDRLNALARVTRLSDFRPPSAGGTTWGETITHVASLEWSLDVTKYLEWVEKGALKLKKDDPELGPSVTTHTYLAVNRLNVRIWRLLDAGVEYRILVQREADDRRSGFLTELMWEAVKHVRVGAGYNFTDFSDNEFSDNDYSVEGWFVRLQAKY